ncbi:MAG TPA: sulfotransferase family protein [Flavobacteriaceae bacterium]|nr:sulfotransferase family protein [Flavobacteriaceae bacterium]MCB9212650.1 sulfotransferase family protein [Alteromonas sp.]HPF11489.1 sulfotransferase family protein [Flavobacteriaceae bacterium]HQU21022.1 sulfotransferase family protein [Flavobacteriaceae bacterium]HQU65923.1 sulfotransferase family protein [Flavobacteriaceae bacterium]
MKGIINLLSGPRNISTALMYSFAQRDDFEVWDEPFYGYYLSKASMSIVHPSHEEVIASMECNLSKIIAQIETNAKQRSLFLKGMAHHILEDKPDFLLPWKNVILIRHPKKLIASFAKVIPNPTLQDIGIKKASDLFHYLETHNKAPLVIDSDELMKDPENYLRLVCEAIQIPFDDCMLHWQKGGISQDGVWAKHWYRNVHQTTGFQLQQDRPIDIPMHLGPLLAEAMPYYETLQQYMIKNS